MVGNTDSQALAVLLSLQEQKQRVHQLHGYRKFLIGRASSNDIQIQDCLVSRQHAAIAFMNGKYFIEDHGSTNGTFLNGVAVSGVLELKQNDILSFGLSRFSFHEGLPESCNLVACSFDSAPIEADEKAITGILFA